ncbi:hypothetical protein [Streptomyces sp. CL12-4]|uniref:hypothetical protein n=1 Tax=Streptomyces sp. CL12-4 TaxID=2810306 RepID=UPI001EFB9865|nr:hypothetical protein [Streptomyces sp. CL12-4]MCG8966432.1 hypothetical protein [Streptomyces sp. CL12-4]
MSQTETTAGPVKPADEVAQDGEQKEQEEAGDGQQQPRQKAWAARRDLIAHGPEFISTLIGGDQFGQSGGTHYGDKIFHIGGRTEASLSVPGQIPRAEVETLAGVFRESEDFGVALASLRADRFVLLSGGRETGRRSAALMLLHRLGTDRLLELVPPASFPALSDQLDTRAGHVLCDLSVSRSRPLRQPHLLALREELERQDAYLVITVEPSAALGDITFVRWEPPTAEDMLYAHVTAAVGESAWPELHGLAPVKEFLAQQHRPRQIEGFAQRLVALHRGETNEEHLAAYGEAAVRTQIIRWLTGPEPDLREQAFLISLAVFDGAPYAVAAEVGDGLFARLHRIEKPGVPPQIPVFGSSREERLRLARAKGYIGTEATEQGPVVGKFFAEFRDKRTAELLLEEVWNLHPSARPALAEWIRKLAEDRRPLVRTRAASAAARLAHSDLSSALAHLIEPWADARDPYSWLAAANALTMAQLLGVPTVLRILHDWCTGEAESRRWTAIRAFGLLGPVHHEEALDALLDAVHRQPPALDDQDTEEEEPSEGTKQFADALELLLLAVREPVLAELAKQLDPHRADRTARPYALLAFFQACTQAKEGDSGRPLVLDWYAQALKAGDTTTARHLALFWEALLSDRTHTTRALGILRGWVRAADTDPRSEEALVPLLNALVGTSANQRRVTHLLRTARGFGGAPSPAADRLLKRLSRA